MLAGGEERSWKVRAVRDQVLRQAGSLCAEAATNVSSGATSSSSAVSRNLCANCFPRVGAPPCISVSSKWQSSSLCNGPSLAIASCCVCSAIVNELVHTRARLMAGRVGSNLAPVPICLRSRPSWALIALWCNVPSAKNCSPREVSSWNLSRLTCRAPRSCCHVRSVMQNPRWLFEAVCGMQTLIIPGFALRHARTVASCASPSVRSHFSSNKAIPRNGRVVSTLLWYRFSRCVLGLAVRSRLIATIFLSRPDAPDKGRTSSVGIRAPSN